MWSWSTGKDRSLAGLPHKSVLILGGTTEASALAGLLVEAGHWRVITSLAGRTVNPALPRGDHHSGGFGGIDGLVRYLAAERIDLIVDATHPFATQISGHAAEAAARSDIPCLRLARPAWVAAPGDIWTVVEDEQQAADSIPGGAVAFLALGRQYLQPFAARTDVRFVIRMVDPPRDLPVENATVILGKPSDSAATEKALFQEHGISHLIARNSGGPAGYGKIDAARMLSLPVLMIAPPAGQPGDAVATVTRVDQAFAWVSERT